MVQLSIQMLRLGEKRFYETTPMVVKQLNREKRFKRFFSFFFIFISFSLASSYLRKPSLSVFLSLPLSSFLFFLLSVRKHENKAISCKTLFSTKSCSNYLFKFDYKGLFYKSIFLVIFLQYSQYSWQIAYSVSVSAKPFQPSLVVWGVRPGAYTWSKAHIDCSKQEVF